MGDSQWGRRCGPMGCCERNARKMYTALLLLLLAGSESLLLMQWPLGPTVILNTLVIRWSYYQTELCASQSSIRNRQILRNWTIIMFVWLNASSVHSSLSNYLVCLFGIILYSNSYAWTFEKWFVPEHNWFFRRPMDCRPAGVFFGYAFLPIQ